MKSLNHKKRTRIIIIFCVLLFTITLISWFEFYYSNKFYPGVIINGKSVGGKTSEEVYQKFKLTRDELTKSGLEIVFEGKNGKTTAVIPMSATGLTPDAIVEYFSIEDPKNVVDYAYMLGREGNIIRRIKEQFAPRNIKNFSIPVTVHREAVQSLLERESRHHFTPQSPAQFSLDSNGIVVIKPEKIGETMDVIKMTDVTINQLNNINPGPVIFTLQSQIPYVTEEKLAPWLPLANTISESIQVVFKYQGYTWKVRGSTLATWLTVAPDDHVTVDIKKLEAFFAKSVNLVITNAPQNSRFKMRNGELIEISPGIRGEVVDTTSVVGKIEEILLRAQQPNLLKSTETIKIKTITTEPQITKETINRYHIKDLLGSATTNFAGGSKDRQHNIEVGTAKITGILIAPGEEFSTANAIGIITEKEGFVKEYVIQGDQTVKELGGGLCQIATTLFRMALNAGLPITERVNHKYVIPYYGPGLDATIYGPHPDFRFLNDTGNYLLLQGITKNNEVTFELYGIHDGRTATVSKPILSNEIPAPPDRIINTPTLPLGQTQCTVTNYKGITADVTYTIKYQDGTTKVQNFHSVYQPWPKICMVGTNLNPTPQ